MFIILISELKGLQRPQNKIHLFPEKNVSEERRKTQIRKQDGNKGDGEEGKEGRMEERVENSAQKKGITVGAPEIPPPPPLTSVCPLPLNIRSLSAVSLLT